MNLQLSLKKQWFEMTKAGIKTEDYREITPYWAYRLFNKVSKNGINKIESYHWWKGFLGHTEENKYVYKFKSQSKIEYVINEYGFKDFQTNIMTLGYPKSTDTERILKYKHLGITIGYGKEEWGAEPNKLNFIIKHGELINEPKPNI